ncbi:MAG: ATP-binding cassette domain-containing protein [Clostridia bacterium]|nr:ATP-binding cassette domain-containing protein [Clostridia bacterium]
MISLRGVAKNFGGGGQEIHAVQEVTLDIQRGEIFGIVGFSGAGKSTLVRCMNLLEVPTKGQVFVDGVELTGLSKKELNGQRKKIGMIFQQFNLFASRTVLENVAFPLKHSGLSKEQIREKAARLLDFVELGEKKDAYPSQLSGGQKQRVAIARALASDPKVLLCDEATSALDPQTTHSILQLLKKLNQELGITIVVITHQMQVVKEICQRVALMEAGRVVEQGWVYDIFAQPQQEITKDFVASADNSNQLSEVLAETSVRESLGQGARVFRFRFLHTSGGKALVSQISREFGIDLNIIHGNLEMIDGRFLGVLILLAQGDKQAVDDALAYARAQGVNVEELRG